MKNIGRLIKRGRHLFKSDSLFRNSVFLMASTAISSALGFGFWLFIAHLYSPIDIGSASALISVTTLLGNISLLGLEASLVRFLPTSKNQSRDINAAIIAVTGASIVAAIIYLFIGPLIGVHLNLLDANWEYVGFVVLMVIVSLNSLTDSIFIANRRAEYHTMTYALLSAVKLILPVFLIPFGSAGIFAAYAFATLSSLILTYFLMKRSNGYQALTKPNWGMISKARKYATNNYIGHILSSATSQVMPIIIIAHLGAAQVAYFAMAWTMANFLYVIPSAMSQSLLAEGATDPTKKKFHVKHAIKTLSIILVPAVALAIIAAPYILTIFGQQYSANSTAIFQILAVATFFIAVNQVSSTILNIEHRSSGVVAAELSSLIVALVATTFLLHFGLIGIGVALLLGNIASNICHAIFFSFGLGKKKLPDLNRQLMDYDFQQLLEPYGITDFTTKVLAKGATAHTFLIKLPGKQSRVLRVYHANRTEKGIEQEIAFMRHLTSHDLPVPKVFPNKSGAYISKAPYDKNTIRPYVIMDFEPGSHPYLYTKAVIQNMAAAQATIHLLGIEFAKTHKPAQSHNSIGDIIIGSITPKGFSHCDFDATNLLTDNQKISCILDFEGMRRAPLVSCLFFTISKIYEAQGSLNEVKQYLTSYQQTRALTTAEKLVLRSAFAIKFRQPKLFFTGF